MLNLVDGFVFLVVLALLTDCSPTELLDSYFNLTAVKAVAFGLGKTAFGLQDD